MDSKNYYDILGITEEEKKLQGDAFKEIVSKKFKKLLLQWHPDKWVNGTPEEKEHATKMTQDISEAREVLSDPQKRQQYDMGESGFGDFGGFEGFGGFNPFGGNPFEGFANMRQEEHQVVRVDISFEEFYKGCEKEISVPSGEPCEHCNGTGAKDGKTHSCPHCNGTGRFVSRSQRGNTIFQQMTVCPHCGGTGKEITEECPHCHGTGKKDSTRKVTINIPAGVDDGSVFSLRIQNNLIVDVEVHVNKDDYFIVEGSNIFHMEIIPLKDALLGCEREIRFPNGEKRKISIKECTAPGTKLPYKGQGIKRMGRGLFGMPMNKQGDYIVIIQYDIPQSLTNKQKDLIKKF